MAQQHLSPGQAGALDRLRRWGPALLAGALIGLFLLSLIPILLVGDCVHPFGDDYAYSIRVHQALEGGTSVLAALGRTVSGYYAGWQGTYSAAVLMALQPGVWGEQLYLLTPIVLLLALILPTGALTHVVLRRWLGQSRPVWLGATAGLLLVTVQLQVSAGQAFFWWNGGVYYTFFYGLMLLLAVCLLRLRLAPRHPRWLTGAAILLAAVIGGGNFVTGLFACLLLAGYALACLLWDRGRLWQPVAVLLVLAAGFLINVLAPGNDVRQSAALGMSVPAAVWASLVQGVRDSYHWLRQPAVLALAAAMAPVLWQGVGRTKFSFPWPAAVTVLLFLALACQNAPHFFALATQGPGRLRNIVFDSFLWLILLGEGYWLGWLRRRLREKPLPRPVTAGAAALALALALTGAILFAPATAAGQCVAALADGSARQYDRQVGGWVETLSRSDEADVTLEGVDAPGGLLYLFTLTDDPENFANVAVANYYGKKSVVALPAAGAPAPEKD